MFGVLVMWGYGGRAGHPQAPRIMVGIAAMAAATVAFTQPGVALGNLLHLDPGSFDHLLQIPGLILVVCALVLDPPVAARRRDYESAEPPDRLSDRSSDRTQLTDAMAELVDRAALRDLAERYAAASIDGTPSSTPPRSCRRHARGLRGEWRTVGTRTGEKELASVTRLIAAYDRTFHFLGNSRYEFDSDTATGEVYCMAHHLTPERHGARPS